MFLDKKNKELPALSHSMNYESLLIDPESLVKSSPIKPKEKFSCQLLQKLQDEEAAGRIVKSSDVSPCVMYMIYNHANPREARFLHDLLARNANTHEIHYLMRDQNLIRNTMARGNFYSKIDMSNVYNSLRVGLENEKYTAKCIHLGTYRTRYLQEGDCNGLTYF